MRVRFQADNDLNKAIVRSVVRQEPVVDFRSAQAGRLAEALSGVCARLQKSGRFSDPQSLPIGLAVDTLILVWAATDAKEWEDQIVEGGVRSPMRWRG